MYWTATSVTVTANSAFVDVTTGDDLSIIRPLSLLFVAGHHPVVVKRSTATQIELMEPWPNVTDAGRRALVVKTAAEFDAAVDALNSATSATSTAAETIDTFLQGVTPFSDR